MGENRITKKNYSKFKKAYVKALKDEKIGFLFEGRMVLTSYARYVIEYWELRNKSK